MSIFIRPDYEMVDEVAHRIADIVHERLQPPEWLTVEQAAEHLALTPRAIRGQVARHGIPFYKAGGRIRFERRELDEWVRSG